MKKLFFAFVFVALVGSMAFAAPKKVRGGNGNGGADKIGVYAGYPFGLSYSHEFDALMELDLLVAYNYWWAWHTVKVQAGVLFTVYDPVLSGLGNQKCPLSIGPVIGGSISFGKWVGSTGLLFGYSYLSGEESKTRIMSGSIDILAPLRWELNFGKVPDFNMFIEAALIGLAIRFNKVYSWDLNSSGKYEVKSKTVIRPGYTTRFGIGLRYRIPNKK